MVQLMGMMDQCFLDVYQFRIVDFDVEVVMGNYYYIGGEDYVVYCILIVNCFGMFNFGDDFCIVVGIVCQVMGVVQVFVVVWERDGQVIDVDFSGGDDISFIFVGQCFGRQVVVQFVDFFVVG